jgi:hypothetical protein
MLKLYVQTGDNSQAVLDYIEANLKEINKHYLFDIKRIYPGDKKSTKLKAAGLSPPLLIVDGKNIVGRNAITTFLKRGGDAQVSQQQRKPVIATPSVPGYVGTGDAALDDFYSAEMFDGVDQSGKRKLKNDDDGDAIRDNDKQLRERLRNMERARSRHKKRDESPSPSPPPRRRKPENNNNNKGGGNGRSNIPDVEEEDEMRDDNLPADGVVGGDRLDDQILRAMTRE